MLFKRRGEKVKFSKILKNGIIDENPVLRLMLGMCPALAVTTSANNGLGMGLAATFVLICSNFVISSTRKIIPPKVRLPVFITVIATFVTIVQMLLKAYIPSLDKALGIFIPLIVVNCIILARAEAFASKNSVASSVVDGIGMGAGFTLALFIIGSIREIIGSGEFWGIKLHEVISERIYELINRNLFGGGIIEKYIDMFLAYNIDLLEGVKIMIFPPGGFLTFGLIVGLMNVVAIKFKKRKLVESGCANCPTKCGNASANEGV